MMHHHHRRSEPEECCFFVPDATGVVFVSLGVLLYGLSQALEPELQEAYDGPAAAQFWCMTVMILGIVCGMSGLVGKSCKVPTLVWVSSAGLMAPFVNLLTDIYDLTAALLSDTGKVAHFNRIKLFLLEHDGETDANTLWVITAMWYAVDIMWIFLLIHFGQVIGRHAAEMDERDHLSAMLEAALAADPGNQARFASANSGKGAGRRGGGGAGPTAAELSPRDGVTMMQVNMSPKVHKLPVRRPEDKQGDDEMMQVPSAPLMIPIAIREMVEKLKEEHINSEMAKNARSDPVYIPFTVALDIKETDK
eukprot:240239_1